MIFYYDKLKGIDVETNYVYSCDMLRIQVKLRPEYKEKIIKILQYPFTNVKLIHSFGDNKYRYLFVISTGESTVTVGVHFNDYARERLNECFVEFNPNKCMPSEESEEKCRDLLAFVLKGAVDFEHIKIKRMDIAIDIPIERKNVMLVRDKRKYQTASKRLDNEDLTEYLGERNNPGEVKLYNKQIESDLDYPLTRLEVTITNRDVHEYGWQFDTYVPKLYAKGYSKNLIDINMSGLSQNDIALIQMLRKSNNPCREMEMFTYRKRKKIEPYVLTDDIKLEINKKCFLQIIRYVTKFVNDTEKRPLQYFDKYLKKEDKDLKTAKELFGDDEGKEIIKQLRKTIKGFHDVEDYNLHCQKKIQKNIPKNNEVLESFM